MWNLNVPHMSPGDAVIVPMGDGAGNCELGMFVVVAAVIGEPVQMKFGLGEKSDCEGDGACC